MKRLAKSNKDIIGKVIVSLIAGLVCFVFYHIGNLHGANSVDKRIISPTVSMDNPSDKAITKLASVIEEKNQRREEQDDNPIQARQPDLNPQSFFKSNEWFQANNVVEDEQDCPDSGYDRLISLDGGSMRPALWHGNHVMVRDLSRSDTIKPGGIVVTNDRVVHAVESAYPRRDKYYLKGYDNEEQDNVRQRENITGVVIGVCFT